ncbi:Cas10/Cmr2 second palm domain-containing protein [Kyrpidia spormannii]|uniref:Cas10/Cmr2 second palm domain-containing protein n=1 Tax=Kyrpidia spormannii TaxID=2055160 RepID=UPI0038B266CE
MYVTPWLEWLRNPFQRPNARRCRPEDLVWQDPVTGTCFGIESHVYDTYLKAVRNWLQTHDDPGLLLSRRFPFGTTDPAILRDAQALVGIALPYPQPMTAQEAIDQLHAASEAGASMQGPLLRTRLGDFLHLRVTLFFALFQPEVNDRWPELRRLLWSDLNPPLAVEDSERLSAVEALLLTGQAPAELRGRRFLFVKGGAVRIKQYYLETADIQIIRGGSRLLDELNGSRLLRWIENLGPERGWIPESVVYSGGGRTLLALPVGARGIDGEPPELAIESLYGRVTITAECAFIAEQAPAEAWTDPHFSEWMSYLETRIVERQMSRPPFFYGEPDDTPDLSHTLNHCNPTPYQLFGGPTRSGSCAFCHFRPAVRRIPRADGDKPACRSCYHRAMAGSSRVKREHQLQIWNEAAPLLGLAMDRAPNPKVPESLVDLGDRIAVVYGDANNLGHYVQNMNTPAKLRYFSDLVDHVTRTAACTALVEQIPDLNFEMIAMAGDDLFFVAPAGNALDAVPTIIERFERALCRYRPGTTSVQHEETMSLSVGVAVGANDQAFLRLQMTADELLKSAKSAKKNGSFEGGTVDFLHLKSSVPYAGRLTDYRLRQRSAQEPGEGGTIFKHLYARPYTASDFQKLLDFIRDIKRFTSSAWIRQLCQAAETMSISAGDLYAAYLTFRDSVREQRAEVVRRLNSLYLIQGKKQRGKILWWSEGEHHYSLWHDVLELWDVLGAASSQETTEVSTATEVAQ